MWTAVKWAWGQYKRLFRTAQDPTVAAALWAVLGAAALAAAAVPVLELSSVKGMLPAFGGMIVLLGSYFAARTLSENERDKATQMPASECGAVRVAGLYRLGELATYIPLHREYVEAALVAYGAEPLEHDECARKLASTLLAELSQGRPELPRTRDALAPSMVEQLRAGVQAVPRPDKPRA
jgi:hypothetical protein